MSANDREQGMVKLVRIGDPAQEPLEAPPAAVAKLFPKNKPLKGMAPDTPFVSPSGVWFMWEKLPPAKKGGDVRSRLHWVDGGKLGSSKDDFAQSFTPSFDLENKKALVVSDGEVFEIDLGTGAGQSVFGRKGGKRYQWVYHLEGGRVLLGETTPKGRVLSVHEPAKGFATLHEAIYFGDFVVHRGRVVVGASKKGILVLGAGADAFRVLAEFDVVPTQRPAVAGGLVRVNGKEGRYEVRGELEAWEDCFARGGAAKYPVYAERP